MNPRRTTTSQKHFPTFVWQESDPIKDKTCWQQCGFNLQGQYGVLPLLQKGSWAHGWWTTPETVSQYPCFFTLWYQLDIIAEWGCQKAFNVFFDILSTWQPKGSWHQPEGALSLWLENPLGWTSLVPGCYMSTTKNDQWGLWRWYIFPVTLPGYLGNQIFVQENSTTSSRINFNCHETSCF